jgi:hypothetical protein
LDDGSAKTDVLSGVVARRMQLAVSGGVPEVLAKASKFVSAEASMGADDVSSHYDQV